MADTNANLLLLLCQFVDGAAANNIWDVCQSRNSTLLINIQKDIHVITLLDLSRDEETSNLVEIKDFSHQCNVPNTLAFILSLLEIPKGKGQLG